MKIGIIGLPMVGKTTLFNLLTNSNLNTHSGKIKTTSAIGLIPDERIDYLSSLYNPKKTTYARIEFVDIPALVKGASKGEGSGNSFLNQVRNVDALIHVIRTFNNPAMPHVEGEINPLRDFETINDELLFSDLAVVEKRIENIKSNKKAMKHHSHELPVLEKCREILEKEGNIAQLKFTPEEESLVRGYAFFTQKPLIVVLNMDDQQLKDDNYPGKEEFENSMAEKEIPIVKVSAAIEAEINQLDEEDRLLFMEELGITEPGINKIARATYKRLGLISFFTVGKDEVRAWTVKKGVTAPKAARAIHTDIERGFIRAEVVAYDTLRKHGSMKACKEAGLVRLEGKDYIVQDGDIISFRFNV
ncbi:redox-regulated ATPase YchF [Anoxybacter fermentans]|uniref:Ribosome-binding ATPase YchF n=1 Tax=Anoxybacter fermentans TaxID=1323375 RepID=A0A3S9SWS3_9FIRM|nr:redox-regulated ATPase YchF [Anoxybacter fermentans]AZR72718.1 redox-regulated ATPase YchF [Anoxybacter fermentans]